MNAVILAAGKGTRPHPLTETLAKPMVPIGGSPVLEHTIRWLLHMAPDHLVTAYFWRQFQAPDGVTS